MSTQSIATKVRGFLVHTLCLRKRAQDYWFDILGNPQGLILPDPANVVSSECLEERTAFDCSSNQMALDFVRMVNERYPLGRSLRFVVQGQRLTLLTSDAEFGGADIRRKMIANLKTDFLCFAWVYDNVIRQQKGGF